LTIDQRSAPLPNNKRQAISVKDQKCAWRQKELALQLMTALDQAMRRTVQQMARLYVAP
jgi:hypothetical protein